MTHQQCRTAESQESQQLFDHLQNILGILSHRLNTPLCTAYLAMESLEDLIENRDEVGSCLDVLRYALDTSRDVMKEMREWSDRIRPSDVVSRVPLAEAIEPLKQVARSLGIELEIDIDEPRSSADLQGIPHLAFVQIGQILLENTRLHNPDRYDLQFLIRLAEGQPPGIRFLDNGRGIPPGDRARIFDPFFSTQGLRRMGLGLPLAHWIAYERFGGLQLGSEPSEFILFLR